MTKQEKVDFLINELDKLYGKAPIPLDHVDPYTLLVAVLLSAQCTDKKVNQVTPALFAKAKDPRTMSKMETEAIREIIRPCGLSPTKSKNIKKLSETLVEKYDGRVPDNFGELEALPGVGHKTASVVMAQAFGKPAFPVDTHIHRLMYRWGLSSGKNVEQTEKDAKRLFPRGKWIDLHLQIILYGREYSPARGAKPEKDYITRTIGRRSLLKKWGWEPLELPKAG